MKPAKLDLPTIWRGCDWGPVTMKWKDADGNPINLSGWQPKAQSINIDLKPVITDVGQGITVMQLSRIDTAYLRLGVEGWDWIWERTSQQYRFPPFLSGKVAIREPLTSTNGSQPIVPPPDNDNLADAILIEGEAGSVEGTTVGSTRQPNEPSGDNSVWYKWTPNRHKLALMNLGMNWLTIEIYGPTGSSFGDFRDITLIATSSGNPSAVSWMATVNVTYFIRIYKRTRTSAFNLVWSMQLPR